ncbi:helix-turn-helix domain-containing protein [Chamaesiphon minutus]|uniref:Transcriptional regulator containing an amidase domain and an AraC-type DNA-binding HTH domain n=1 Tax=Chamaesiphon minutus (strain ATCC 27169 / PCC 6605) TaxID=1173020 RepID=K9UDW6_CHAP6|nr:AraC family transcriptional regulator [Chamaesiphon minutus]AFY93292.1 transcriptional regulator containing an amidase domain and an AraC-type DNA-binding HTH domain [Chamaesiphon minutus PCC 6605]
MKLSAPTPKTIDYRQANASDPFVPNPAVLASSGWDSLHVELHQQPKFEVAEHQHTMHVIAFGLPNTPEDRFAIGERWLAGTRETERRQLGDIAIIPAGIAHRCNWSTTARFGILAIEHTLLQQVGQDWINPERIELMPQFMSKRDDLIQSIFATLSAELATGGIGSNLLVDSLKTALAIHLLRNYCTTSPRLSSYADGLSDAKLTLITNYINSHLDLDLKLTELSSIAQISPYHFLRLFKKSVGITPHQYILQQRIDRAKYLLESSNLDISEIAFRVGFCDSSHLTRCFKSILGKTPRQWRQL